GHGGADTKQITIDVNGTNDVPVIGGVHTGAVTEDVNVVAGNISATGVLSISDVDAGQSNFAAQAGTLGSNGYGTFALAANGSWTYTANDSQSPIQQLGAGHSLHDALPIYGHGGADTQQITIDVNGTNDVPVIGGVHTGAVTEDVNVVAGNISAT